MCAESLSHIQLFATPWTVAHQAPLTMGFFQAQIPGVGYHFLLQGLATRHHIKAHYSHYDSISGES